MKKTVDLTGRKFGRLTVAQDLGTRDTRGCKRRYWLCQCECGNMKEALAYELKSGHVQSCGCLKRDNAAAALNNLKGQQFGLWTVVNRSETKRSDGAYWICKCDCGTERTIRGGILVQGKTKSCGCDKKVLDDFTGMKIGRLTPMEYLNKKKDRKYVWRCLCDCGNEYEATATELKGRRIQSCGCIGKEKAAENIREAVKKNFVEGTNIADITIRSLRHDNKTGVRGVTTRDDKFRAKIGFQNKQYRLGTFDTLEEATYARKEAEVDLYDNFLDWYYKERANKNKPEDNRTNNIEDS